MKHLNRNQRLAALFFVLAGAMLVPDIAAAGTGTGPFDTVWTMIVTWTQSGLGRVIAGTLVLVGIVAGIARQSLMAFATGIGAGIGLYNMPTIIDSIFTATLPVMG